MKNHWKKRVSIFFVVTIIMAVTYIFETTEVSAVQPVIIDVTDYGAIPDSLEDAAAPVQQAIAAATLIDGPVVISFPEGRYDFYSEYAEKRPYYISNTASESENADVTKTIGLLLKNLTDVTIEGNDSLFILHGKMTSFVIDQSENIEIRNVRVDYERPTISEAKVIAIGSNYIDFEIHRDSLYEIRNNRVHWVSERNKNGGIYWEFAGGIAQEFDPVRNITWRTNNPFSSPTSVQELSPFKLRLTYSSRPSTEVGRTFQMRDAIRTQVGGFIHQSKDVVLRNVKMHYMHGLGIVGQYSENFTLDQVNFSPRSETGRTATAFADFVQASGMKGKVTVTNSVFSGSHDDVINVHGTHLKIQSQPAPNQIVVRFMHHQTYGFEAFYPGDIIDFIDDETLKVLGTGTVASVTRNNAREILLTLEENVPQGVHVSEGVVVENATWTTDVEIRGNHFSRVPTRGILLTTRGTSVIEDNVFERMQLSGILIANDAKSWYESGMVRDVTIRNNTFIENGGPVIYIAPENEKYDGPVHRNITIEGNVFEMLDNTVLNAKSTEGIRFINNEIRRVNTSQSPNNADAIYLLASSDVEISGNTFTGNGVNKTVVLDRTPSDRVVISPAQNLNVVDRGILREVSLVRQDDFSMKATATSEARADGGAKNAIDGNVSSIWHSEWTPLAPLPQSITLELDRPRIVKGLYYTPRQDGGRNGNIGRYKIYTSIDGTTFEEVANGTWSTDSSAKSVSFDPIHALFVKLEILEGYGGFASAAEIRIDKEYTVGENVQLQLKGMTVGNYEADLSRAQVTYASSNEAVAQVDSSGRVTSLSAGIANITASVTLNGTTLQSTIPLYFHASDTTPVEQIIITSASGANEINVNGGTLQMVATIEPEHASNKSIRWGVYVPGTNDLSDIAEINNAGLLTALKNGTVEVRASSADGSDVYGSKIITIRNQITLSSLWFWIRENKPAWSLLDEEGMRIKTEHGNLWAGSNTNKNILLVPSSEEDFSITGKLKFKPTSNYAEAGLIVYSDDSNYFYVARKHHPSYGGPIFTVISETNGVPREEYIVDTVQADSVYLQVTKEGNTYKGYYSLDQSNWIQIGSTMENSTIFNKNIGIFANNTGGGSGYGDNADFAGFHLNDELISFGENDSIPNTLKATLDAVEEVRSGEEIVVSLGLSHINESIQAQDIVFRYDSERFDFVDAQSKLASINIVAVESITPGQVRLLLASLGEDQALITDGQFIELTLRAKASEQPVTGVIEISKFIVSDSNGVETTAELASKMIHVLPLIVEFNPDINNDGKVSIGDLAIVAYHYGKHSGSPDWNEAKIADVTRDGKVDVEDLAEVSKGLLE